MSARGPWLGVTHCGLGGGTGMERWHSSAQSPEVSLSGGAGCSWGSCWGVQPGAGQPQAGAVWSGRTPVLHSLLPHEDSSQEWWLQQLEPDFVPAQQLPGLSRPKGCEKRGLVRATAIFPVNRSCCSCNTSCSHTCSNVLFGAYVMGWRGSSEGPTPWRGTRAVSGWQNEPDFSRPC